MTNGLRVLSRGLAEDPAQGSNQAGATLVEFTVVAFFILFFIIATVELLRMSFTAVTLQFAVDAAQRNAVVNRADANEIAEDVIGIASGLSLQLDADPERGDTKIDIFHRPLRAGNVDWSAGAGREDSVIRIEVVHRVRLLNLGPAMEYTLSGLAIGVRDQ